MKYSELVETYEFLDKKGGNTFPPFCISSIAKDAEMSRVTLCRRDRILYLPPFITKETML